MILRSLCSSSTYPIDTYFVSKDDNGVWLSITDAEAQEKFGKSAGEIKGECEVSGTKLILNDYYSTTFKMEDRAIERLTDLNDFWMPYVDSAVTYPVDCVFTKEELDTIDRYKPDFESTVAEQEGLWIKRRRSDRRTVGKLCLDFEKQLRHGGTAEGISGSL